MAKHILFQWIALALAGTAAAESRMDLVAQVRSAETSFAQSMADRDLAAFMTHVDDEAIFFSENGNLRGAAEVKAGWAPYFEGETPPFSWQPNEVEVLGSGNLALSSGPVLNSEGQRVGTFNSIWRRGKNGAWKVIFDKGSPECNEESP